MNNKNKIWTAILLLTVLVVSVSILVKGDPVGGSITSSSSDPGYSVSPVSRSDEGGTFTTMNLDATQQNYAWKAYIGNISGTLVLDDSNSKSIYGWSLSTLTGEIYASRWDNVTWSSISCADATTIGNEESAVNMNAADVDSISNTFADTDHSAFTVAGTSLSSCPYTATYVNDTSQTVDASSLFQQILINDSSSYMVYASSLEEDVQGYDNSSTFDFQVILPDDDISGQQTTYYFYVELDS